MAENVPEKSPFSDLMQIGIVVKDIEGVARRLEALGIGTFEPTAPPPGAEGLFLEGKPMNVGLKQLCTRMGDIEVELI